jgi:hypothetical protein
MAHTMLLRRDKRSGRYHFRLRVPDDLRTMRRWELKRSLGTTDLREAKLRYPQALEWAKVCIPRPGRSSKRRPRRSTTRPCRRPTRPPSGGSRTTLCATTVAGATPSHPEEDLLAEHREVAPAVQVDTAGQAAPDRAPTLW